MGFVSNIWVGILYHDLHFTHCELLQFIPLVHYSQDIFRHTSHISHCYLMRLMAYVHDCSWLYRPFIIQFLDGGSDCVLLPLSSPSIGLLIATSNKSGPDMAIDWAPGHFLPAPTLHPPPPSDPASAAPPSVAGCVDLPVIPCDSWGDGHQADFASAVNWKGNILLILGDFLLNH